MFDDIKQDDQTANINPLANQSATPSPSGSGSGQVVEPAVQPEEMSAQPEIAQQLATPTPKSSIDDMFNDIDPVADKKAPDNFIDKPSAIATGKLKPISGNMPPVEPMPEQPIDMNQILVEEGGKGSLLKKILVAIVGLVLVVVVIWTVYYFFFAQTNTVSPEINPITNTQPKDNNIPQENNTPPEEPVEAKPDQKDDDSDGLTNSEEATLATNPNSPDTDNDGLFDREEVKTYRTDPLNPDTDNDGLFDREEIFVWETDPLNPDTDNDGYLDGVEVANGYNPAGDGLLPEAPAEIIEQ